MTNRTEKEVRNFNEAINKCRMPVFLVSSDGTEYNMKSADQKRPAWPDGSKTVTTRWKSTPATSTMR